MYSFEWERTDGMQRSSMNWWTKIIALVDEAAIGLEQSVVGTPDIMNQWEEAEALKRTSYSE